MDKQNRSKAKLLIPRFFKSSYASCRSRLLSNVTSSQPLSNLKSSDAPNLAECRASSAHVVDQGCSPTSPVSSWIRDIEFYQNPISNPRKRRSMMRSKRRLSSFIFSSSEAEEDEEVNDGVLISSNEDGDGPTCESVKKDSTVVVMRISSDPYEDFRTSMVEMIVERQTMSGKDLEKLLERFLALNSRHHHRVILQVFMEIWDALFRDWS